MRCAAALESRSLRALGHRRVVPRVDAQCCKLPSPRANPSAQAPVPVIVGAMRQAQGSYLAAWLLLSVLMTLGSAAIHPRMWEACALQWPCSRRGKAVHPEPALEAASVPAASAAAGLVSAIASASPGGVVVGSGAVACGR